MSFLVAGGTAPRQSTPTSCGPAALVMARALIDPAFAAWLAGTDVAVDPASDGAEGDATAAESAAASDAFAREVRHRWATAQAEVASRTNAVSRRPGIMQTPWPLSLGTPPWGARSEIERSGSAPGVTYEIRNVRFADDSQKAALFDGTVSRIGVGRPVLLYVGNGLLPRHIVLWARTEPGRHVVQYDPFSGQVATPDRAKFMGGRLALAGWNTPWFLVRPDPVAVARESSRFGLRLPQPNPGIA